MADDPVSIVEARKALGAKLAALRSAVGYTQETFAPLTFYGRSSIANLETGRQNATREFWTRCDDILQTSGVLTREHDRIVSALYDHQRQTVVPHSGNTAAETPDLATTPSFTFSGNQVIAAADSRGGLAEDGGDVIEVLARLHRLNRSVDPAIVDLLHTETHRCLTGYETANHAQLTANLVKQRAWIETLFDECRDSQQLQILASAAAMTSGLLGYIAVGTARFTLARAYLLEAFRLAELAHDANLQAWTRATQSFCEYYAGDYRAALQFAHAGRAIAGTGPQSVRLTVNGLARAAGKLGDADTVHRAVDEAHELAASHSAQVGVPSSISLTRYGPAQIAGNAATAYVALGMPDEVQKYAALALPDAGTPGSTWTRSLVTIDIATSLIRSREGALDHATSLVAEALAISRSRPVVSIQRRAAEFLDAATTRWGHTNHTAPIRDALATMDSRR
ncbi:DNA-binding XRE family transcriptional regulator [Allocatelliglobosispora scoriae]|uniref:DNA-binding XRE family transcriptional regulator n=1 Tax=Allocatelliglobosispora scoriae TaxID=643052 RepID=A0A841BHV5_9ACTN|nr:helix-turn-helix transcriptional regulator [Allocatelliglobosispora scoriae]MBB5866633.1 DNA-binding XRE family transcriptional regulator [Allocatelliglobosispora scoriae]